MKELKDLISEYYPVSDDAWKVVENSLKLLVNEKMETETKFSIDFGSPAIFLSRILHRLEENGNKITFLSNPACSTYRTKYQFGSLMEMSGEFREETILSVILQDLAETYSGKSTFALYSIKTEIDAENYEFITYIRGNIN